MIGTQSDLPDIEIHSSDLNELEEHDSDHQYGFESPVYGPDGSHTSAFNLKRRKKAQNMFI